MPIKPGDTVSVHYVGTLNDGSEFDRSREGNPLRFKVGSGQVIPGFDKAVVPQNRLRKRSLDTRPPIPVPIRDVAIHIDGSPIKHRIDAGF